MEKNNMTHKNCDESSEEEVCFSSLQVHITLVAGEKIISLQELMNLKHGDIMEFSTHIGDPLTLWSDGQKVAQGELICEEDTISLLITHVYSEHSEEAISCLSQENL